jgi:hypothetical protein
MAVIITRKDCTLSEANAFYRVESYNTAGWPDSATFSVAVSQYGITIPLTFANAGIFKGIVLTVYNALSTATDRGITLNLIKKRGNVTFTIASPGIVHLNSHGYSGGEKINFQSTGTLPTGITANRYYYVKYIDESSFNIALTEGGANVNFSGTPSGTAQVSDFMTETVYQYADIQLGVGNGGGKTASLGYVNFYLNDINFTNFDSDVTVNTDAGVWNIIAFYNGTVGSAPFLWYGKKVNTWPYYAYCNNQVSFSNDDTVVFAHYCDIDTSFSLGGVLGDQETVIGVSGVVCANPRATSNDDVAFLRCLTPAASYTMSLSGALVLNGRSGFRVGTSTSRIPASKQFNIILAAAMVGTARGAFRSYYGSSSTAHYMSARASLVMYGEYPTTIGTYLSENAALSQNKINVVGNISEWASGHSITIGWGNVNGVGEYKKYVIDSINGQEITLTGNITGQMRRAGGMVINLTDALYGIRIEHSTNAHNGIALTTVNSQIIDGAKLIDITTLLTCTTRYYCDDTDAFVTPTIHSNMACESTGISNYYLMTGVTRVNRKNNYYENWWGYRTYPSYPSSTTWLRNTAYRCGKTVYRGVHTMSSYAGFNGVLNEEIDIDGYHNNNQRASYGLYLAAKPGSVVKNCYIYGCASYNIYFDSVTARTKMENIYLESSTYGIGFATSANIIGLTINNMQIGQIVKPATNDVMNGFGYYQIIMKNCIGIDSWTYSNNNDAMDGTFYRIVNRNGVFGLSETHFTYGRLVKCGYSMPDEMVRTSGNNKY